MNDIVDQLAVAAARGPFAADRDEMPSNPPNQTSLFDL
jgi:hypothetical protein